jgi:S-adenosylmethionine:tRNA ribosyltransferase-isomerase
MKLSEFRYELPEELIAQEPLPDRADSKLLVVYRQEQRWEDRRFRDLPSFLTEGDCLVVNDTRVFPCRLFGKRSGTHALPVGRNNPKKDEHLSGKVEVFLLRQLGDGGHTWEALVRPGRKMAVGEVILFDEGVQAEIIARGERGLRTVRFAAAPDLIDRLHRIGHIPLPPYIRRQDRISDQERYQTVFAKEEGSAAAPTAGLHFTPEMLERCRSAGADLASITLHVGLGTFLPLDVEEIEDVKLHSERFSISQEAAGKIGRAKRRIAVGTTSVRTLETAALRGPWQGLSGETDIFIHPGCSFLATDALVTNFHLPESSLLLLVSAFGGTDLIRAAYNHAVHERYRFFSYGDCMLVL